jgi:hypothetical protein
VIVLDVSPGDFLPSDDPDWELLNDAITEMVALRTGRAALRAELAAARPVVAAAEDWGRARREEVLAVQASFDANHRGPAWFARCVAGETRVAAEGDLFAAWEEYARPGGPRRRGGQMKRERTIGDLFGMLDGMKKILREEQRAVRETNKAIAEMEAEIVQRCAADQEAARMSALAGRDSGEEG